MDVATLIKPLYRSKKWVTFIGVMLVIYALALAATGEGIIVAWVPVWVAVLCFQLSKRIDEAYTSEEESELLRVTTKLSSLFTLIGVVMLVSLTFIIFFLFFFPGGPMSIR